MNLKVTSALASVLFGGYLNENAGFSESIVKLEVVFEEFEIPSERLTFKMYAPSLALNVTFVKEVWFIFPSI